MTSEVDLGGVAMTSPEQGDGVTLIVKPLFIVNINNVLCRAKGYLQPSREAKRPSQWSRVGEWRIMRGMVPASLFSQRPHGLKPFQQGVDPYPPPL